MSRPEITKLPGIIIPDDATIETLKAACECNQSDYAKQYLTDKHFKVTVHGPRNLFLAHFKKNVTSEHVETVAKEMGYNIGLVEDLLCVGAHPQHRELQRQFPIIALVSSTVMASHHHVPYLDGWDDGRDLGLDLHDFEWDDEHRFLFVGKDESSDA